MSSVRLLRSGKYELQVRHPKLPKGRKFFTFDSEAEAKSYGEQWDLLAAAGAPLPTSLLERPALSGSLGHVLRARANNGLTAMSDQPLISLLLSEVGKTKFDAFTYAWCENWVRAMKLQQNLAPSSIRKRVGMLSRAVDDYARKMPDVQLANPLKLLPDRYSAYSEQEKAAVVAAKMKPKEDRVRERRLHEGEEERINDALRGVKREDKQRALPLPYGDAQRVLFQLIVWSGLRLKEAYTLRRKQIDLASKVIHAQKSKLWHGKVAYKDVPIRRELHPTLETWLAGKDDPDALIFPFWDGEEPERAATNRLSSAFRAAFDYAKCAGLTEHDLRHEATCRWLELRDSKGQWMFREEEIHRIMGWAPGSKMASVYASFRGDTLAKRLWD